MAYSLEQIRELYALPLTTLIFRAQTIHHRYQDPAGVQLCTLQSIKTGGCPEDCAYCPQSSRYTTAVKSEPLMDTESVVQAARQAKAGDALRFCMGAAWRKVPNGKAFHKVLETVSQVRALGLEVCCTFGMLNEEQAQRLKAAGCTVYNHNLDTSRQYYANIITTRTYDERLATLAHVRRAGMEICCGGILGMGESLEDRLLLLQELANLDPQPESVPINALVAVKGTPLEAKEPVDPFDFVRIVATARILMPKAMVRLSAGRMKMSEEMQALCFLAGANSLFLGDTLLTTPNPERSQDRELLAKLGLHALVPEAASDDLETAPYLEEA